MSAWRGWNEAAVRPHLSHANTESSFNTGTPAMAGFTAINASVQQQTHVSPEHISPTESQRGDNTSILRDQPKSVASDYLGRGKAQSSHGTAGRAPQTVMSKKTAAGSKKRSSTANDVPKAKRQKGNEVLDDMPVTKTVVSDTKPCGKTAQDERDDGRTMIHDHSKLPVTKRVSRSAGKQMQGTSDIRSCPDGKQGTVSVFAPVTTMDMVQSSGHSTSLDTVKQSARKGNTLYNATKAGVRSETAALARPWLNKVETRQQKTRSTGQQSQDVAKQQSSKEYDDEDDDEFDELMVSLTQKVQQQLPTPVNSNEPQPSSGTLASKKQQGRQAPAKTFIVADDEDINPDEIDVVAADQLDNTTLNLDSGEDEDLIEAAKQAEDRTPRRNPKHNMREVDPHEDYGGALLSETERKLLKQIQASAADNSISKPIVRKPFPEPMLDRSPIFGATNATVLRTCFRVGEALNVGCQAVRQANGKVVLVELYARVVSSHREEVQNGRAKQHFVFHDLYHDHPPHVTGTFDLWGQSRLWDHDSKPFLAAGKEGMMCRVVGRMKRDGVGWRLEVLSIWEASWEDVEYVAGIYVRERE